MGKVRIIGGKFRSRFIIFNDNNKLLRPTLDRIRETIFNWLDHNLSGQMILDLYAGSGALGFEALSRGATKVVMLESNLLSINYLNKNKGLLKCNDDELQIINQDAIYYLTNCYHKFDIIFLDPPYHSDLLQKSLTIIYNRRDLFANTLIYIECEKQLPDLTKFKIIKNKTTAQSKLHYMLLQLNFE